MIEENKRKNIAEFELADTNAEKLIKTTCKELYLTKHVSVMHSIDDSPTSGKRKCYKVFGLIDYLTGKFFYKAHEGRLNSDSYQLFLTEILAKTRKHIILIQDGARCHTSKAMKLFFKEHADRITVYQLPSYSPDYNHIEALWKKIKHNYTHLHYFPTFESLTQKVNDALLEFENLKNEVLALFGLYDKLAA